MGDVYGALTVLGPLVPGSDGTFFPVMCAECGNPSFRPLRLLSERTRSCGCMKGNIKHRGKKDRLYQIWVNMRARCMSPTASAYRNYGARGIAVDSAWDEYAVFRAWALGAGYRDDLTLERVDNDGMYSPDNCVWATRAMQSRNRRTTRMVEHAGETKCLKDWSGDSRCAVSYATLYQRVVRLGWPFETALTTPVGPRF